MKKIILIAAVFLSFQTILAQTSRFNIVGSAPKILEGKKIYLDYVNNGFSVADSAVIHKGKFAFKGIVEEPNYARLTLDHDNIGKMKAQYIGDRYFFYIGNEDYNLQIKDSIKNVQISGSLLHQQFEEYLAFIGGDFMNIIAQANATFDAVPQNASDKDEQYKNIKIRFEKKFDDRNDKQLEYAKTNKSSLFAVEGLTEVANKRGSKAVEEVFMGLNRSTRNTIKGRELESRILADKNIVIGSLAPNFSQPDQNGKIIQLSDFKGKYVLLDFWASWCVPCREENPNLKKAFIKYNPIGLEVFAISIDEINGKNAWLKAITDDDLPWYHAADLKGWRNEAAVLYGVRGVPQNYLIDPHGKIIAINLKGENLHKTLAEIIK